MKDYHVNIFYSDEDDGYIADIPDLKACSAFGETPNEALTEVMKAKESWGWPPQRRTASQFRNQNTVRSSDAISLFLYQSHKF
jgi:hypothetical protein